ncbi:MAG: hypothetical protein GX165_04825 [Firmicutes bacterium]|jgi:hypothetical protein|nr:hypothetical protein [Bacillota bacterium]
MFLGLSGMAAREGGGNAGRKARWLWILVLVGLLASSGPLWQRGALERQNNAVELIFDYDELETLAELADRPLTEVVGTLAPAGITTLAVRPATLNSLLQRSRALAVSDRSLFVSYGMTGMMHPALAPLTFPMIRSGAYIVTRDRETVELLSRAFDSHLPEDWEVNHWEGYYAFYAGAPFQRVSSWSLGYLPGPVGLAQGYGLFIAPRPSNQTIGELPPDPLSVVIFEGMEMGGYPDSLPAMAAALEARGAYLGLIEFAPQKGDRALAKLLDHNCIRVHSITPQEMSRYRPEEAITRYVRAVRERGVRALYLRPFLDGADGDLLELNAKYVAGLKAALEGEGYRPGRAVPLAIPSSGPFALALIGLAIAAGGILLLASWPLLAPIAPILAALGLLGTAGVYLKGYTILARQILALTAAVVFPTLGVQRALDRSEGRPPRHIADFLVAVGISLSGGIMVAALLTEVRFALKTEQFLGVKLAHVLPVIFLGIYLWRREKGDLLALWRSPLEIRHGFYVAALIVVALIYVGRTGNYFLPVMTWEARMRELLEGLVWARPRTKEFLLGHPALLISLWLPSIGRRAPWWLILLGSIGCISLVNTFAHAHSPLVLSLARTGIGIVIGLGIGLLATRTLGWLAKQAKGRGIGL